MSDAATRPQNLRRCDVDVAVLSGVDSTNSVFGTARTRSSSLRRPRWTIRPPAIAWAITKLPSSIADRYPPDRSPCCSQPLRYRGLKEAVPLVRAYTASELMRPDVRTFRGFDRAHSVRNASDATVAALLETGALTRSGPPGQAPKHGACAVTSESGLALVMNCDSLWEPKNSLITAVSRLGVDSSCRIRPRSRRATERPSPRRSITHQADTGNWSRPIRRPNARAGLPR